MAIKDQYLAQHPTVTQAATAMAQDLMRGDPGRFKAGYSADSALIAAIEVFALNEQTASDVAIFIGADESKVSRWVDSFGPQVAGGVPDDSA